MHDYPLSGNWSLKMIKIKKKIYVSCKIIVGYILYSIVYFFLKSSKILFY